MPVTGPGGEPGKSRAQQIAYYAQVLSGLPGTYQGNYKQYDGKNWSQLYTEIANSNPNADPKQLADAVLGVEAAQRLGTNTQAAGNGLGKFVTSTEHAAAGTDFAAGVPNPIAGLLPGLASLAAVFEAVFKQLTKASMWRSLGWIVLGGVLIVLGIVWWARTAAMPVAKEIASHVI